MDNCLSSYVYRLEIVVLLASNKVWRIRDTFTTRIEGSSIFFIVFRSEILRVGKGTTFFGEDDSEGRRSPLSGSHLDSVFWCSGKPWDAAVQRGTSQICPLAKPHFHQVFAGEWIIAAACRRNVSWPEGIVIGPDSSDFSTGWFEILNCSL